MILFVRRRRRQEAKKKLAVMFLSGLFVLTSSWCFADTSLLADLTGGPYAQNPGYIINPTDTLGFEFAPSATATLDSIEIALSEFAPDPVTVTLYQDISGAPGTIALDCWTGVILPTFIAVLISHRSPWSRAFLPCLLKVICTGWSYRVRTIPSTGIMAQYPETSIWVALCRLQVLWIWALFKFGAVQSPSLNP